jgi:hypothetical protein
MDYVWKPLTAFCSPEMILSPTKSWDASISKGQDLVCKRCLAGERGQGGMQSWLVCDSCKKQKASGAFEPEMQSRWLQSLDEELLCKACGRKGRPPESEEDFFCLQRVALQDKQT